MKVGCKGWHVDGYAQYGTADNTGYQQGILLNRMEAAVDAVVDPNNPTTSSAARRLINPTKYGDCVPLNLFGRGNASDAAIAYVTRFTPGQQISSPLFFHARRLRERQDGHVHQRPRQGLQHQNRAARGRPLDQRQDRDGWGAGPIAAAFGLAWRKEEIDQIVYDPSNPASDPGIFPAADPALRGVPPQHRHPQLDGPELHGGERPRQLRREGSLHRVAGAAAPDKPLVKQLNLLASARYANYEGSGGIWSWKYGLDWQVIDDLRLRGTVSRDVRAATLSERFNQTGGFGTVTRDPQFPNDGTQAFSIRTGGNPTLDPEKPTRCTFGVIYQPAGSRDSRPQSTIGTSTSTAPSARSACSASSTTASPVRGQCQLIARDPTTQRLTQVVNVSQNIAAAAGRGVDLEIGYRHPINLFRDGAESVGARLFYSHLLENSTTSDPTNPATKVDLAGQTGAGGVPAEGLRHREPHLHERPVRRVPAGTLHRQRPSTTGATTSRALVPTSRTTRCPLGAVREPLGTATAWELSGGKLELYRQRAEPPRQGSPPVVPAVFDALARPDRGNQVNSGLFDLLGRRYTLGVRFRH